MIVLIVLYLMTSVALAIALGASLRCHRHERTINHLLIALHRSTDCIEKQEARLSALEQMFAGNAYRRRRNGPTIEHEATSPGRDGRAVPH